MKIFNFIEMSFLEMIESCKKYKRRARTLIESPKNLTGLSHFREIELLLEIKKDFYIFEETEKVFKVVFWDHNLESRAIFKNENLEELLKGVKLFIEDRLMGVK